ncbi:hypothetical protein GCM10014719_68560 [Planomonospora parontospora subsp. antibiotica]|nr:hypothetical protein GCM10014719_68560 [Planomonospora parontospora subsp. antibiotica]GII19995.1 hypothetical protein Ppa05_67210 [Planomonospora parontospora subsp. antibiotica]
MRAHPAQVIPATVYTVVVVMCSLLHGDLPDRQRTAGWSGMGSTAGRCGGGMERTAGTMTAYPAVMASAWSMGQALEKRSR